ncbi:MAG: Hsp33 family molecular chaperone HslO [Acidobacteria bacterium]|nr:Hsp33 family molecular chaperone HslO [Acidobacteriota bacterium]
MNEDSARRSEDGSAGGGRLVAGLAAGGSLRWVVADLTLPLEEVRRRLDLSPISAVALGRALVGAVLLRRIALKVPARLILTVDGDGALGRIVAEVESRGAIRGMVGNSKVQTPADGAMAIAPWVGRGSLNVTREIDGESYSSKVELVSGEIGKDLAHYLEQSEQTRSAVLVGVLPESIGIAAAGGLIVEALPGTPEEVITRLEGNLLTLGGVSKTLALGGTAALEAAVLAGFDREPLEEGALTYHCRCNREQLRLQLKTLAQEDIQALFVNDSVCEAECTFCGERYEFSAGELTLERLH